jgi:hypothetical protein
MTKQTITIHNVETGEIKTREMNAEELAQAAAEKLASDAIKAKQAETESHKAAAQAKLAALGLTADDLKALGL